MISSGAYATPSAAARESALPPVHQQTLIDTGRTIAAVAAETGTCRPFEVVRPGATGGVGGEVEALLARNGVL